jgi:hypothetical protein
MASNLTGSKTSADTTGGGSTAAVCPPGMTSVGGATSGDITL